MRRISRLAFGLLLVAAAQALFAADSFLPENSRFTGAEAWVPMRDGKQLAADVYVPKAANGPLPTILIQTPYNKQPMRRFFNGPGDPPNGPLFGSTDYAFVITDWRGRSASADAMTPTAFPGGAEDGYDTIEWVVDQPWSNGKICTWGPSALGRVQYQTASAQHPAHVCAAPSVMPLNLTYDIYFPGGALWEEFVDRLGTLGFDRRAQLIANPVLNDTWRELERTTFLRPAQMQIPMFIYGGWFDIYADSVIETYQAIRSGGGLAAQTGTRLMMGPWIHGSGEPAQGDLVFANAENYGNERALAFFEHHLRGVQNDETNRAAITYYQMGENEWRTTDSWPPSDVKHNDFYLSPDGALRTGPAAGRSKVFVIKADPENPVPTVGGHLLSRENGRGPMDQREKVESREDVIVFSTGVLEEDLAVTGQPLVRLFVSTDGPDTDFTALLTDVYPDGRSIVIAEGIQRLRFREGVDREVMAAPDEVYEIEIELQNTAITFRAGHRARLILASSSSPHWSVNPNDGGALYDGHEGRVATNAIHTGAGSLSRLVLPVVGR